MSIQIRAGSPAISWVPMFDVAIIGAGPAGTAAAYDLLASGLTVLLLDKHAFPRKKACAGGITPKAIRLFRYDVSSMVKRECRILKIQPQKRPWFFLTHSDPLCHMTRREELDFYSLNKVIEKGADFKVVKKILSICETPAGVEIYARGECFKASYLIGADGANSVVRKFVFSSGSVQKQFAIEADIPVSNPEAFPMEFDFSRSKNGYYWIFPKDDHLNIGIYAVGSRAGIRADLLAGYAAQKGVRGKLHAVKGYPICTHGLDGRAGSKRILLAGDAAGMSERLLGEGIYFAVKSGQEAAFSIVEAFRTHTDIQRFYWHRLREIRTDLRLCHLSSKLFYAWPRISLKALSMPFFHTRFVNGYAAGKPLSQIFYKNRLNTKL